MEVSKIPTDNSAHINKNIKSNIPMYRILFLKLVVQLITKLIPAKLQAHMLNMSSQHEDVPSKKYLRKGTFEQVASRG